MNIALDRRRFLGLMGAAATFPAMSRFADADTPFNFQASWINDAEFCGYFVAADKGFIEKKALISITFPAVRMSSPKARSLRARLT